MINSHPHIHPIGSASHCFLSTYFPKPQTSNIRYAINTPSRSHDTNLVKYSLTSDATLTHLPHSLSLPGHTPPKRTTRYPTHPTKVTICCPQLNISSMICG